MKNILQATLALIFIAFIVQCTPEDPPPPEAEGLKYELEILSPDTDAKHVGDTIQIQVVFSEANGDIIHHINVQIHEKGDTAHVVYNMPAEAHVHQMGTYTFTDEFVLEVPEHTDWVLQAKVWGEAPMEDEKQASIEFHVHP